MAEEKEKCPYCGSSKLGRPTSNLICRGISKTAGVATGLTLGAAGTFFTLGKAGNWIAKNIATNVIEPIGNIVKIKYKCKSCNRVFEL